MKFIFVLLLVVLFVTYNFGESLAARRMMHDYDYDEKTINREEDIDVNKFLLTPKGVAYVNQRKLDGRPKGEEDIDVNRFLLTPKDVAYINQRKLDGRPKGSGTSLKKMDYNEEVIPINEVTRDLFRNLNPKPESQPVSEPTQEDNFNQMENKVQDDSEATKTESNSVDLIQTNCYQNYISPPGDGLLLRLWEIFAQLLNFILCLVTQCVCENYM